ncbi:MAG: hypothetical protein QOH59_3155 [Gemmatimonadales bacterium]|jgi:hypothetical protein|nr:hypothetical protein [Gemmatimonadales bacterium]
MYLARLAVIALAALAIATPASAQFGGLKKKVKAKAGQEAVSKAAGEVGVPPSEGAAPADRGGMIVLTKEVVNQLLAGLKAGQAEREAAAKEDTPFGRYTKAKAAFTAAQPKCEKAQQTFYLRAESNKKLFNKWTAYNDKVTAAQEKGDLKLAFAYQDSASALMDPSCIVKEPEQPEGYYEAQRDLDRRAEKKESQASGFSRNDLAMVKERATAILEGAAPPGGASAMEKSAVSARKAELKPLLGIKDQPPAQAAAKPAPAPAPTPAAPSVDPQMSAAASGMNACMVKNIQKHEAKLEALGERLEAAEAADNMPKMMAIADTIQRIQMAGCR